MKRHWRVTSDLDYERSIWVEPEDLGTEKLLHHGKKYYKVKLPLKIDKKLTLRLRGLGKTKDNETGDLLLHIWLNKGGDTRKSLWLSETSARNGASKILSFEDRKIRISIPEKSYDGLVIRLRGLGKKPDFTWRAPFLRRRNGDLLVKLTVYPDNITPKYGSFERLSTDDMTLEGWVYRRIDEIIDKIGKSPFLFDPIQADTVADRFNEYGWRGIPAALIDHLGLTHLNISCTKSDAISSPGNCQKTAAWQTGYVSQRETTLPASQKTRNLTSAPVTCHYMITINELFLDNPFSIAAIVAHELCHVVYSEIFKDTSQPGTYSMKTEQASIEEERTVDLLVFMFKIGQFQLRVSRDKRLSLGYFNQRIFDRIQVIVSRKLNSHQCL